MPEIHLRQPQFTYSTCGTFTKHEQRIQKFKETGDTNYVYKNELDKACFVHDAAYSDSKDLTKRTIADKNLKNKAFDIAKDPKYDGNQRGLASMVYKFFDSKVSGSGAKLIPEIKQLANELHKPIIRKFEKRKVYSTIKDNIWGVDLADMRLLSKYNKGIRFFLCVTNIFSKYAWVVPLKDKKDISIVKAFQSILKQSNRKPRPNKIWVDKGQLAVKNKLQQKEYIINENERELSFNRGFFFYTDQSYLKYECKMGSFDFNTNKISKWKSTGIFNRSSNSKYHASSNMDAVGDSSGILPNLKNDSRIDGRMNLYLSGNHFQQNVAGIPNINNVINIYCVYKLDPIASTRDTSFTIQDALFGAM